MSRAVASPAAAREEKADAAGSPAAIASRAGASQLGRPAGLGRLARAHGTLDAGTRRALGGYGAVALAQLRLLAAEGELGADDGAAGRGVGERGEGVEEAQP